MKIWCTLFDNSCAKKIYIKKWQPRIYVFLTKFVSPHPITFMNLICCYIVIWLCYDMAMTHCVLPHDIICNVDDFADKFVPFHWLRWNATLASLMWMEGSTGLKGVHHNRWAFGRNHQFPTTIRGFRRNIFIKLFYQDMSIYYISSPTSRHLHPPQVENCDSNSRFVVDEDDNVKLKGFRFVSASTHVIRM